MLGVHNHGYPMNFIYQSKKNPISENITIEEWPAIHPILDHHSVCLALSLSIMSQSNTLETWADSPHFYMF